MKFILLLTIFLSISSCVYAQEPGLDKRSFVELFPELNKGMDCARFTVGGPCPTPKPPYVGVWITYFEPSLYMETVHAPGDYVIREAGALLVESIGKTSVRQQMQMTTGSSDVEPTSTSGSQSMGGSNLQFNEVHLYDFPLKFVSDMVCPSIFNNGFLLRYLSEVDAIRWRQALGSGGMPSFGSLSTWGNLHPRIGFMVHSSPLVASAASCMKAVDIMGEGLNFGHNFTQDKVQLVYPYQSSCLRVGENLRFLESPLSKDQRFVWIYWTKRSCCRTVSG